MSILKKEPDIQKIDDPYYNSFHGFNRLEKEFRADGWFHGRASDYAAGKKHLISEKPRNCLVNQMSDCYFAAPVRTVNLLTDSATVVHGPIGCGTNLYDVLSIFKTTRLLCTNMGEKDAIMGGEGKLKATIQEAYERFRPGVIAVIETCTSSIIGDDLEGICETMEQDLEVTVLPFHASGFRHRNWNLGFDESFNQIIDRMQPQEPVSGTINYLNFAALSIHWKEALEVLPYLSELGIRLNAMVPCFMTFQEMLETFPRASLNVVRCPSLGMQTAEYAEKVLGMPYARVPKPVSLKYTADLILTVAEHFGLQEKAESLISRETERVAGKMAALRKGLRGKRIAISAGPGKNIGLAQLAVELGMEVVYLGPLKTDSTYHELLQDFLESTGQDPEVMAEASVYEDEAIMSRLKPDVFVGLMENRVPISRLGIPCIDMEAICVPQLCGFGGAVVFGEYLADVLENRLIRNWGQYLYRSFPVYSSRQFLQELPEAFQGCHKGRPETY